ncbi:PIN domain-containing protein, partial [bacterium]|nr:PIN domain-containing protein [bacterium]
MKKLFLDTDVLIDFLSDRQPYSEQAVQLFAFALKHKFSLLVSALSFDNVYYVLRRNGFSHAASIRALKKLQDVTDCVSIHAQTISAALESDFKDFEDGIQYHTALEIGDIDFFITRNL